jgi:hypothetical protein
LELNAYLSIRIEPEFFRLDYKRFYSFSGGFIKIRREVILTETDHRILVPLDGSMKMQNINAPVSFGFSLAAFFE